MDFSTAMIMEGVRQTLEFMRDRFPWISLLVLLVTALIVMAKEKRRRALLLERSEEEARILSLPDVSDTDKELLLKAAEPLPVTKEAYPLPDVPLRLISALAKVFGFLKLFLLAGVAYSMVRVFSMPGSSRTSTHPVLFLLMVAGLILLSMLQIIASAKVTRGSIAARRFLIFMAVFELGTMMQDPDMAYAMLWRMIVVAMSGYMLWVLLIRSCALSGITYQAGITRRWQKAAVVVLAMYCLFTTPFDLKMNSEGAFHRVETSVSSGSNSGITLPISRIYLQAGDESAETLELIHVLKERFTLPVELLEFGQVAPATIHPGELFLLVCKTLDENVQKESDPKLPLGLLKGFAKENPEMARLFMPQPAGDEKIAFRIDTPFSQRNFAWTTSSHHPQIFELNSPDVRMSVSAEYDLDSRETAMNEMADSVVQHLSKYLDNRGDIRTVDSLPQPLTIEPERLPEPVLGCMSNAVSVAYFFAPQQQLNLYRLAGTNPEFTEAISNQLVSAGWESDWGGVYRNGDKRIFIEGPAYYASQQPSPYFYLIYSKCRDEVFPESFPSEFCQQNYADFIAIFYARSVPEDVLREATLEYLEQPDLSAWELYKIYDSLSQFELLGELLPDLLFRFASELRDEPLSKRVFSLYRHLGRDMTVDRLPDAEESYAQIDELYGDQIIHLHLVTDSNGMDRAEIKLQDVDRPRLVTLSKTRNDPSDSQQLIPMYFLGWIEALESGKYKTYGARPTGAKMSEGTEFRKQYMTLGGISSGTRGGASFGEINPFSTYSFEDRTKPGRMTMLYEFSTTNNTLNLEVLYNDNTVNISHGPDGRYFLNKELISPAELHERLKAMHEQADIFGLYVSLRQSEKSEFQELISDLPRPSWIKYNDLPESGSVAASQ